VISTPVTLSWLTGRFTTKGGFVRILSALFGSSNDNEGARSDYDGRDTIVYPPHPSDPRPYTAISSWQEGDPDR
jgi:hypothetical protein